jgi:cytochrome c556
MQPTPAGVLAALLITLSFSGPAGAETTAENSIKYREAVMETMAGHIGAFSLIAFGMVEHQEFLQSHADALADGGAQLKLLFPEGSGGDDTDALPAIWENPEEFNAAVAKAEKATAELPDAAASGDRKAIIAAFKAVGESCKGCHEKYREEHDH